MVQNSTPKDETALLPLLRQDCSRVRSEGSTCAIQSNLTSWKRVWAWSDAKDVPQAAVYGKPKLALTLVTLRALLLHTDVSGQTEKWGR